MITETFLNILKSITSFFVGLFPQIGVGQELGSLAGFVELIASSTYFVPYSTLFICLGIWVIMHQAEFVMSILNWVIGKIPTIT